jgi:anti-anti-sigma factor
MQATSIEAQQGPLKLFVNDTGSTRTITLAGELDLSNVGTLSGVLSSCEDDGVATIVVDLESLEFIDSSGIALLVQAHNRLVGAAVDGGPEIGLRLLPSRAIGVQRVLAVTGVDRVLPFLEEVGT